MVGWLKVCNADWNVGYTIGLVRLIKEMSDAQAVATGNASPS
jgi:hypothetical protein